MPRAAMADGDGATSKVRTKPPSTLTSATPGRPRSAGRMVQSIRLRCSNAAPAPGDEGDLGAGRPAAGLAGPAAQGPRRRDQRVLRGRVADRMNPRSDTMRLVLKRYRAARTEPPTPMQAHNQKCTPAVVLVPKRVIMSGLPGDAPGFSWLALGANGGPADSRPVHLAPTGQHCR